MMVEDDKNSSSVPCFLTVRKKSLFQRRKSESWKTKLLRKIGSCFERKKERKQANQKLIREDIECRAVPTAKMH